MNYIQPEWIGSLVPGFFEKNLSGKILGVISAGIYILGQDSHTLFLTPQKYRGPFSINLPHEFPFSAIQPQTLIQFTPTTIQFPELKQTIHIDPLKTWTPDPPARTIIPIDEVHQRCLRTAMLLTDKKRGQGFAPFLMELIHSNLTTLVSIESNQVFEFQEALSGKHPENILHSLQSLIGLGKGLTPSGDDLLSGLFLTLARYPVYCTNLPSLNHIIQGVLLYAYQKTTLVSANILECAVEGEADERLITALDILFSEDFKSQRIADLLDSYGNSSGADFFAGVIIGLKGYHE